MPPKSKARKANLARQPYRKYSKNMKKTTKKGAYKKGKVKAMAIRRNPMVENKKRELANITIGTEIQDPTEWNPLMSGTVGAVDSTGIFSLLPLTNYTTQFQVGMRNGVDSSDRMSGTNLFGKYLTAKGIIRFPAGINIQSVPQNLELIWGWVPAMNATVNTAPAVGNITPANVTNHIISQVAEFLNARTDQLRYVARREQHIQILGRRRIRPNLNRSYAAPAQSGTIANSGVIPDVKWNCKWPLMKKVHYDFGGTVTNYPDTPVVEERCFNLNDDRLPFLVFYQPDANEISDPDDADEHPQVAYNSMFYFTDS